MKEATHDQEYTPKKVLYLALELGNTSWNLGFSTGIGQNPRQRKVTARDVAALRYEIRLAKQTLHLPANTPVKSCYEAGRDGFWLHRCLLADGIDNQVVDSSSIEVKRRARRTKTDGLDVVKLLTMLIRYHNGEPTVWSVTQAPTVEQEDQRHLHRQLSDLKTDRTRHINRLKGLLASQGVILPVGNDFLEKVKSARLWDGSPIPPGLMARLERDYRSLIFIEGQIDELKAERRELIRRSDAPAVEQVRQLMTLRGIGENSAWVFVMEFFAWRHFHNRREVGALAGLAPTLYQSGDLARERGISKAGNRLIRAMAIEIAWSWLRFQPQSDLSVWYKERYGQGAKRQRKVGIVAVARKLLIVLWRYLNFGEIPAGAFRAASAV